MGWSSQHGEGLRPLCPLVADCRHAWDCTERTHPNPIWSPLAPRAPGRAPLGTSKHLQAGRGVISARAAGRLQDCLLLAGRRKGRSPGSEAAEQSRRVAVRKRVRGTLRLRVPPAPSADCPAAGWRRRGGIWKSGRAQLQSRASRGGSLAKGLERRLSNPAQASGSDN